MSLRAVRSPDAPKITTTVGGAPRCLLRPCRNGWRCVSGMREKFVAALPGRGKGNARQKKANRRQKGLAAEALGEKRDVLEMPHLRRAPAGRDPHLHHVEPERRRRLARPRPQVGGAGASQHLLLPRVHRVIAGHQRAGRPRLHLDKDQHLAVPADKVDLIPPVARAAPVSRHDREAALAAQKLRRRALSRRAAKRGRTGRRPDKKGFEPGEHRAGSRVILIAGRPWQWHSACIPSSPLPAMATPNVANTLRRSLLIKIISKPAPSREDLNSVVELTASKVVEALQAQSMTLYLVEGNDITFKHVYYSPTLWASNPSHGDYFKELTEKLLATKLPLGTGNVGKVIASGQPLFFNKKGPDASSLLSMAKTTGFEVHSMLTVPLKSNVVIGAIQVLNKEPSAATGGEFTQRDLTLLQEVAEYSANLIQRMLDPKFQISAEDTAKFIARFTDLPLVTKIEDVAVDDKLIEVIGEAIIRREGIFPLKKLNANHISALMANPLDHAKRDAFQEATEFVIDEVNVAPATLIELLLKKYFKDSKILSAGDVDIDKVAESISSTYAEGGASVESIVGDLESEESAPIIQLANRIIEDAYIAGASDIHIEPQEKELLVRYRVDGICQEKLRLPKQAANALVTRLKIMCNLDIAE